MEARHLLRLPTNQGGTGGVLGEGMKEIHESGGRF